MSVESLVEASGVEDLPRFCNFELPSSLGDGGLGMDVLRVVLSDGRE